MVFFAFTDCMIRRRCSGVLVSINPPAGLPKIDKALAAAQKLLAVDRAILRKNAESADTAGV